MTLPETKRVEIVSIASDISETTRALKRKGIEASDPRDMLDAFDIIARIERRMLAKIPAAQAAE